MYRLEAGNHTAITETSTRVSKLKGSDVERGRVRIKFLPHNIREVGEMDERKGASSDCSHQPGQAMHSISVS